jgi:YHS domain-containing protein
MGLSMRKDPVCKMDVSGLNDPETTVYKKNPYFFCSEKCRDRFLNDPDLFISETKKPPVSIARPAGQRYTMDSI